MAPKKKKGGKKKSDEQSTEHAVSTTAEPSDKEILLQAELTAVTEDLTNAKRRVEDLRKDNEWLQQEAQKIRIESHEYMSYIEKKASKRQTTIVTLSDHNKQEIINLDTQRKELEAEFDEKKNQLKAKMLEKQHILAKAKKELENMQELKSLQTYQTTKIKDLEAEITRKRMDHSMNIQELKARFLQEKKQCQDESDDRISTLKNEANKEAMKCLAEHTNNIKVENRMLREKLMNLIKTSQVLQTHDDMLEDQRKQLLREQQYTESMRALRSDKLHELVDSHDT